MVIDIGVAGYAAAAYGVQRVLHRYIVIDHHRAHLTAVSLGHLTAHIE